MAKDTSLPPLFELEPTSGPGGGSKSSFTPFSIVKRVITSATLLIIAYITVFLINQYVTGLLCLSFGYSPIITYNHIDNLPYEYRYWSLRKVTIIYASGPVLCLIIGIFALDLFNSLSGKGNLWRCFVLWFTICSLNLFLSYLLVTPMAVENYTSDLYSGISVVAAWWRLGKVIMIPLSFIALTVSILIGYLTSSMFIKFSYSKTMIDTVWGRRKMLLQLYVLPLLIAAPILILLANKRSFLIHFFHLLNMLMMAIGLFIGADHLSREIRVYGKDVLNTIPIFWLTLAGGLVTVILLYLK